MKTILLILTFVLLCSIVIAENNLTNTTNCTAPIIPNITLNFSLVPSQFISGNLSNCFYNLNVSSCGNATSSCVVNQHIDAGNSYSLHTSSCDLDFQCDYEEKKCSEYNRTENIQISISKEDNKSVVIKIGDTEKSLPIDGTTFSYSFSKELQCPAYQVEENLSWTYEKCKTYLPRLVDDDKRWEFYSSSFNQWSTKLGDITVQSTDLTAKLAACIAEKDGMQNTMIPKDQCGNIQQFRDCQDSFDTMKIKYIIAKVIIGIESAMILLLVAACVIFIVKKLRGD